MAKFSVHVYVETGFGDRPIEYQVVRNEALQLPADAETAAEALDEMITDATQSVATQAHQLARSVRA